MAEFASKFETRRLGYPTLRVAFLSQDTQGSSTLPINALLHAYPADLQVAPVELNGSGVPGELLSLIEHGEVDLIYYEMPDFRINNPDQKEQIASVVKASKGKPVFLGTTNENLDEDQLLGVQEETGLSGFIIKDWKQDRFHRDFIKSLDSLLQVAA
jgi:hypothetical protein